jgi:hypothetical protein
MKKLVISLTGALALIAALPAIAGPNWQLIEQGRKDKIAQQVAQPNQSENLMKQCADMMKKST